jgi:energy-coupling factor transport system permease protein
VTKLLWLVWILVAAFLLPAAVLIVLVAMLFVVASSARLLSAVARSLRIPAILVLSILVVNALFFPSGDDVLVAVGPIRLTSEGILFGLVSATRLLVAFMASVLFLLTTLADDLLESLVRLGVSHRIAYVVLSAVQLVPRLQDRAAAILGAQQARGLALTGSLRSRLGALVPLVGPILLGSLIDVRERTFALEARAFGSGVRRTAYRQATDPPIDRWLRWLTLGAIVATVVVGLAGVGR